MKLVWFSTWEINEVQFDSTLDFYFFFKCLCECVLRFWLKWSKGWNYSLLFLQYLKVLMKDSDFREGKSEILKIVSRVEKFGVHTSCWGRTHTDRNFINFHYTLTLHFLLLQESALHLHKTETTASQRTFQMLNLSKGCETCLCFLSASGLKLDDDCGNKEKESGLKQTSTGTTWPLLLLNLCLSSSFCGDETTGKERQEEGKWPDIMEINVCANWTLFVKENDTEENHDDKKKKQNVMNETERRKSRREKPVQQKSFPSWSSSSWAWLLFFFFGLSDSFCGIKNEMTSCVFSLLSLLSYTLFAWGCNCFGSKLQTMLKKWVLLRDKIPEEWKRRERRITEERITRKVFMSREWNGKERLEEEKARFVRDFFPFQSSSSLCSLFWQNDFQKILCHKEVF